MRNKIATALAAIGMAASGSIHAEARLGPELSAMLGEGATSATSSLQTSGQQDTIKVVVTFNKGEDMNGIMKAMNVPFLAMKVLPMVGAELTPNQIKALQNNPAVESIYYDAPLRYYNYNSGEITGGHFVHDNFKFTGKGGVICVLDSGIDATHPDLPLGDKVIQNVKLVGDLDLAGGVRSNIEYVPNSDTSSGHGTHVAGTVAGTGAMSANDSRRPNAEDGIAPDAKLVGLGAGEAISILYSIQGFDYALANQEKYGIDVITNSWGGGAGNNFDPHNPTNKASFEAYKRGMVVTFAASNDGPGNDTLNQYAIAPWVINVAAGTRDTHLASFSSRGIPGDEIKTPDITAPGSTIYSTHALNTPLPKLGPVLNFDNPEYSVYYATMSGTSMATPFVAGAVAVLLEANPDLSPDQIDTILKATADNMYDASGRMYEPHEVGAGHINLKAAVEMAESMAGDMRNFLMGDTEFATRGKWTQGDNTNSMVTFTGGWAQVISANAYGGSLAVTNGLGNTIKTAFRGDRAKVHFEKSNQGGAAQILVDGKVFDTVSFNGNDGEAKVVAINGLTDGAHTIEVRTKSGRVAFDRFEIDGDLTEAGAQFVTEQMPTITGTIIASASTDAAGLGTPDPTYYSDTHEITLNEGIVSVKAVLSWDPFADLDFALLNAAGEQIASSASLDNPEVIEYDVTEAGTYSFAVKGYTVAVADYKIEWEVVKAN